MGTLNDAVRMEEPLKGIAEALYAIANENVPNWVDATLDARWSDAEESCIHKVRVNPVTGPTESPEPPTELTLQLFSLGEMRPEGKDRWHGIFVRVTSEGSCEVTFNYDPLHAEDLSFYDS